MYDTYMENLTAFATYFDRFTRESDTCLKHSFENDDIIDADNYARIQVGIDADTTELITLPNGWGTVTKARIHELDVVFWNEHPAYSLAEENGEEEVSEETWEEGEECIRNFTEEYLEEALGVEVRVISKESEAYDPMGGRYVKVALKNPVSVTFFKDKAPHVRLVQSTNCNS